MKGKNHGTSTLRLLVGVAAFGAAACGVALYAAPSKKPQPKAAITEEMKDAARKRVGQVEALTPKRGLAADSYTTGVVRYTPQSPFIPDGSGGVANAVFSTGFETTDSPAYSLGALVTDYTTGQNGWHCWDGTVIGAVDSAEDKESAVAAIVSDANPATGVQHVRFQPDGGFAAGTSLGAFSPIFAPSAVAASSLVLDVYIAHDLSSTAQYNIRPRDTAGSDTVAANVAFWYKDLVTGDTLTTAGTNTITDVIEDGDTDGPDLCVLDDDGLGGLAFRAVAEWPTNQYFNFKVQVDPINETVEYSVNSVVIYTSSALVSADNVDSFHVRHDNRGGIAHYMDIDDLGIEVKLIPGACCDGSTCTLETSNNCNIGDGKNFLGPATDCTGDPCANGRCCATDGGCTITAAGSCSGPSVFTGGFTSCAINCCDPPLTGGDSCDTLAAAIPVIPVPGTSNRTGNTSTASGPDCVSFCDTADPPNCDPLWWEAFTITTCAKVTIDYCCSAEAAGVTRAPVYSTLLNGCPCETATSSFPASATSSNFVGGTLAPICDQFHAVWNILPAGTYYIPMYVNDNADGGEVANHDYQMHITTEVCPVGGCCVGSTCVDRNPGLPGIQNGNVFECDQDGGNYLGDNVACTFACASGACCDAAGTCTSPVTAAVCNADSTNSYFGGSTCAMLPGDGVCPPPNDRCAQAQTVTDGVTPFTIAGARTDGPSDSCGASPCLKDVWYNYTATCTGDLTVSMCNPTGPPAPTDYDATLFVYDGQTCPVDPGDRIACDDDGCGAGGSWSEVTVAVTNGQPLKIRVGAFQSTETGNGDLTITCTPPAGIPCTTALDCREVNAPADNNGCNCASCPAGICVFSCVVYGNTNCAGPANPNLDDILCVLAGFSSFASCPNGDIAPCAGNNIINLDDILAVLGAFSGGNPCGCQGVAGTPPACGGP